MFTKKDDQQIWMSGNAIVCCRRTVLQDSDRRRITKGKEKCWRDIKKKSFRPQWKGEEIAKIKMVRKEKSKRALKPGEPFCLWSLLWQVQAESPPKQINALFIVGVHDLGGWGMIWTHFSCWYDNWTLPYFRWMRFSVMMSTLIRPVPRFSLSPMFPVLF